MSAQLEQYVRQQLPGVQLVASFLGAIQLLEFRGVGSEGWAQYDVHGEHGTSRWQILLSADGKIASAKYDWDRPKSVPPVSRNRASPSLRV
jgi:hypothetical protein